MESEIFTLPQAFGVAHRDTLIYHYSTGQSSANNKVVFTKNMFCLLLQGCKEVHTAGGKEVVSSNEMLMLAKGSVLMSETITTAGMYKAILIFFGDKTLLDYCTRQSVVIKEAKQIKPFLKIKRDDFLNNYCHSLQLLQDQSNKGINELKVHELLGYLHTRYPETFTDLIGMALANEANIKLKEVVELNYNKGLSTDELAFLCNMSVSTFKRHFVEIYNIPPQKYFIQLKMEQAARLLQMQRRPSEIYSELGYENISAFSHEFKKYFGVSPGLFRNKKEPAGQVFELLQ